VAAFELGDGAAAEGWAESAVAVAADFAEAHATLGHIQRAAGRLDDAEARYRSAARLAPRAPAVLASLGSLLLERERPDEAEPVLRRAIEAAPRAAALHDAHARSLEGLARLDEAERAYGRAIAADPRAAAPMRNLGNLYQRLGRFDAAAEQYRRALALAPKDGGALSNLGLAHYRLGRLDEAEQACLGAIAVLPGYALARYILACIRLKAGKAAEALEAAQGCLALEPGNGSALALKAILLAGQGRDDEASALADFDRFIRASELATPPGFASLAAFNAALAEHVSAAPSRLSEPGTAEMRQTHDLMRNPAGPAAAFAAAIDDAVRAYAAALPADPGHSFVARRPAAWRLVSWATILKSSPEGEVSHLHPTAWLSGVYYPQIPPAVGESQEERAGWIEFGRPPPHLHAEAVNGLRFVRPQEGLLLLFPSYFYHRVRPFRSDRPRISVAFDVVPVA
jgi:uncharacterized protein (TIGR02466 family)